MRVRGDTTEEGRRKADAELKSKNPTQRRREIDKSNR